MILSHRGFDAQGLGKRGFAPIFHEAVWSPSSLADIRKRIGVLLCSVQLKMSDFEQKTPVLSICSPHSWPSSAFVVVPLRGARPRRAELGEKEEKKTPKKGETCCPSAPAADCQKRFTARNVSRELIPCSTAGIKPGRGQRVLSVSFRAFSISVCPPLAAWPRKGEERSPRRLQQMRGLCRVPLHPAASLPFHSLLQPPYYVFLFSNPFFSPPCMLAKQ